MNSLDKDWITGILIEMLPYEETLSSLAMEVLAEHFSQIYDSYMGLTKAIVLFDDEQEAVLQEINSLKNKFIYYTEPLLLPSEW